jgi:hypothetical protein
VRTGAGAGASLAFFDGSTTRLDGGTELTLEELTAARGGWDKVIVLRQSRGRTRHDVEPLGGSGSRFEVGTPLATTLVRGTSFDVRILADGTTEVSVRRGSVCVLSDGKRVELEPGWATTIAQDGATTMPYEAPEMSMEVFTELALPSAGVEELEETEAASATATRTEAPVRLATDTATSTTLDQVSPSPSAPAGAPTDDGPPASPPPATATATATSRPPTVPPTATPGMVETPTPVNAEPTRPPTATPDEVVTPTPVDEEPTRPPTATPDSVATPTPVDEEPGADGEHTLEPTATPGSVATPTAVVEEPAG